MDIFQPFNASRIDKPWGHELIWAKTGRYVGKILHIEAGHSLSLQYHQVKEETLLLLTGEVRLTLQYGDERRIVKMEPRQSFHIVPGLIHRLEAISDSDVLEVSTTELDDVVRLEDNYGRRGTSAP